MLAELLRLIGSIPDDIEGDAFGKIYEYFLGNFAMTEGQTRRRVLHADLDRPADRRDHRAVPRAACTTRPAGRAACSSSRARFVERAPEEPDHRRSRIYGQERVDETVPLAKMNLAVHGLVGRHPLGNTYYDDLHDSVGQFDFVMANPPFNVNGVDKDAARRTTRASRSASRARQRQLPVDPDLLLGAERHRPGRVRHGQLRRATPATPSWTIRRKLIEDRHGRRHGRHRHRTSSTPSPCPVTLWFLDKGKTGTERADTVLFIDARHIYRQIDRAHRDFLPEQHRVPRQHRPPLPRRGPRDRRRQRGELKEQLPRRHLRRRARPLQGRHHRRDRSPRLEPQPRPLHRHRRRRGRRRRLPGEASESSVRGVHQAAATKPTCCGADQRRRSCQRDTQRAERVASDTA